MYQPGEYIVYGTSGVCKVDAVGAPPFEDENDRLYYTLSPIYGTETIYLPIDSKVFTRPIITKKQAEELIHTIPSIEIEKLDTHNPRMRGEYYEEVLNRHDCEDLVQLIKTVYAKSIQNGHRISQIDQRYKKRAEDLLHGELSVALGIPVSEVPSYITQVIEQQV